MPLRPLTISGSATDAGGKRASASVSVTINEPTLFGSSVILSDGTDKYSAFDSVFGDIKIARTYSGLNKDPTPYTSKYAGEDVSHNAASATSFKYYPADVLSGSKDATLVNYFAQFKPGKTRWWTYWHEPDGEIYGSPQVYTAADYRAAFTHVNAIAVANVPGNVDARPYLCVEEYSMRPANAKGPATARPFASFYPGDFIQAIGFDVYSGWNESSPYTLTPSAQFDKLFTLGQQYGKPLCFPELGSSATSPTGVTMTRAQWMTNALRYIRPHADQISWITWWCDQFADISADTACATIWKNMCMNGWNGTP
jgi:hypothetical protein